MTPPLSSRHLQAPPHRSEDMAAPHVSARDRRTLEVVQFYPLPTSTEARRRSHLDLYFFFPRSFGISKLTWPDSSFYRESKVSVRLRARSLRLADLADLTDRRSPGCLLMRRIEARARGQGSGAGLVALAQMYGAEITDAVKDEIADTMRALEGINRPGGSERILGDLSTLCADIEAVFEALRQVHFRALRHQARLEPGLVPSLEFAEEYAAATVDEHLSRLILSSQNRPNLADGQGTALKLRLAAASTLERISARRHARGYVTPDAPRSEYYGYRLSLLKKELQQALYVDTRAVGRDPFYSNSAAMVAAALAATWATLAQVPLLQGRIWSTEGMVLLAGAVGAYVLKDRIKDIVKQRLLRRWSLWDHDERIVGQTFADLGLGGFGGRARERVRWTDPGALDPEIRDVRRLRRTVRGAAADLEHVIHYHREVELEVADSVPPAGFGVQEIFRMALDDVIRRLDDPLDTVWYYDASSGRFIREEMPRVYHLNLVAVSTDVDTGRRRASKTRVVVNQHSIVRLERVGERELPPVKPPEP